MPKKNVKFRRKCLKPSSKRWLMRQWRDPYVRQAKMDNYRCRSAYKLLEIQDKYQLMQPGHTVLDLGCCPGSWTQVAVKATDATNYYANSYVLGLDLKKSEPILGANFISGLDFTHPFTQPIIRKILKKRKIDVILSDLAPNMSGILFADHLKVENLNKAVFDFVQNNCEAGAHLVMKTFDGEDSPMLLDCTRYLFDALEVVRPKATRKASSEVYYVGISYKQNKLPPHMLEDRNTQLPKRLRKKGHPAITGLPAALPIEFTSRNVMIPYEPRTYLEEV